jgi:hypothetical protein
MTVEMKMQKGEEKWNDPFDRIYACTITDLHNNDPTGPKSTTSYINTR